MKLEHITSFIEGLAPKAFQENYDNSGLILGGYQKEVTRVLVCLDGDMAALDQAIAHNCQLLISHHPMLFKAVKILTDDTRAGSLLTKAIKNDIALYSAHTNFDSASGGLTDCLCRKLGLTNVQVLKKTSTLNTNMGWGRFGEVSPISGRQWLNDVQEKLSLKGFRWIGDIPSVVKRVAVFNGSYDREILPELKMLKPDALITGDLKYHDAQELTENEIFTVDAGHYGTEKLFVEEMISLLQKQFPDLILIGYEGEDIFRYACP
jgi:dinuclear metal center YbgI/SA1388 family protein